MNTYFRTGVVTLLLGFSLLVMRPRKVTHPQSLRPMSVSWIFSRMMNS